VALTAEGVELIRRELPAGLSVEPGRLARVLGSGTMTHLASDAWFEWHDPLIVVNSERPSGVAHEAAQYRR
jgi:hypothetical protein